DSNVSPLPVARTWSLATAKKGKPDLRKKVMPAVVIPDFTTTPPKSAKTIRDLLDRLPISA
ncbi:hypothetical protein HDV00_005881, partial [Rhizophlyctis rosea]